MEGEVCCFIGHRKIERTDEMVERLKKIINDLIFNKGVKTFLFGSRSEFDDLCHEIVTELQKKYPQIKRIMYTCRSEYAVKKEEKEDLEKSWRNLLKREVKLKDYDGAIMSDRLWRAGKASYVERNQDMINASDYCIFYYNSQYQPPKRKYSKRSIAEYQPKSGTAIAYEYAWNRKELERLVTVINIGECHMRFN